MWIGTREEYQDDNWSANISIGRGKDGVIWIKEFSYDAKGEEVAYITLAKESKNGFEDVASLGWNEANILFEIDKAIMAAEPGALGEKEMREMFDQLVMEDLL